MMKKIILALLLFSTSATLPIPYDKLRNDFKHKLYLCQTSLMKKEAQYNQFIEPYLQEAEKNLQIPRLLRKNNDLISESLIKKYFACIKSLNIECFYACARKHDRFFWTKIDFFNIAEEIKNLSNLDDLDIEQEWEKTKELFIKANKAYIKKLAFWKRLLIKI